MKYDRRIQGSPSSDSTRFLTVGSFILDLHKRTTTLNNHAVLIPPCTFDYLATLMRHAPEPVSYKNLVYEAHHQKLGALEAQDLARINIYMLRKALEPEINKPRYLLTVAGYGYRLASS